MKPSYSFLVPVIKIRSQLKKAKWLSSFFVMLALLFTATGAKSQQNIFIDATSQQFPGLPQLSNSSAAWADYDGDGRQDVLITGLDQNNSPVSKLFHNTKTGFVDVSSLVPGLPQVFQGSVAWGDYNKDGKPDFFICGNPGGQNISKLYQNTGNGFVDKSNMVQGLLGFVISSAAWGNWNNNYPSLIITGLAYDSAIFDTAPTTRLYNSTGDSLVDATILLPGVPQLQSGYVQWVDYDNDGLLDLMMSGLDGGTPVVKLYHNNDDNGFRYFDDRSYVIPGSAVIQNPAFAWANFGFDNSGLPSLVMTGQDATGQPATQVYVNQSNRRFLQQSPGIVAVDSGAVAWGDYDNDGRPDLLISGSSNGTPTTKLYHNTQNGFVDVTSLLPGISGLTGAAAAWADYDHDGWTDLVIIGDLVKKDDLNHHYFGALYRNTGGSGFEDKTTTALNLPILRRFSIGYGSLYWSQNSFGYWDLIMDGDVEAAADGNITGVYMNFLDNQFWSPAIKEFVSDSLDYQLLPPLKNNAMDWADFNKDGQTDVMIIGEKDDKTSLSQLLKGNIGNTTGEALKNASDLLPGLPNMSRGSVKWGDYDNDGWPDLAICGIDDGGTAHTIIYHNEKGTAFTNVSSLFPNLPIIYDGSLAWGDYDQDGRVDLLLSGSTAGGGAVTKLYHTETNGFTDKSVILSNLPQLRNSTVSFADCNNDGLLDILVTGADNANGAAPHTTVALYYNSADATLVQNAGLLPDAPGVYSGSVVCADYDNDGKTDIFITGATSTSATSALFHNTGSGFENTSSLLPIASSFNNFPMGITGGSAAFVDYDVDGRQDLFLTGFNSNGTVYSGIWHNGNASGTGLLPGITGLAYSSTSWGDYDNDGKLDLIVTGQLPGNTAAFIKLYHHTDSAFEDKTSLLPGIAGIQKSAVAWGDYDNDGKLDLFILGSLGSGDTFSKLYHNTGNGFEDATGNLPGFYSIGNGAVAWGDYDNDGKLDLIITGETPADSVVTFLYHNKGDGSFEGSGNWLSNMPGVAFGSVSWADYDKDGRLDLFLSGINPLNGNAVTNLYHNTGSGFVVDENWGDLNLPGLSNTSVAWSDYDNDGWMDLFITGQTSSSVPQTHFLKNYSGTFIDATYDFPSDIPSVANGSVAWGDFDNDGLQDLILTGQTASSTPVIKLYHNTVNFIFEDVTSRWSVALPPVQNSSVAAGDYDNDGRLDFIVTGDTGSGYSSVLFHNPWITVNTPPAAPVNLAVTYPDSTGTTATLSWHSGSDGQTAPSGLSYGLYIGDAPGGQDVLAPMADQKSGFRRVVSFGFSKDTVFTITGLKPGTAYYWSAQSVDASFAGSPFAAEQKFTTPQPVLTDTLSEPSVKIGNVSAVNEGKRNRIDWNTTSETKGDWFIVEKLMPNGRFVYVDKVFARGRPSYYTSYDYFAVPGRNSYRIKVYDNKDLVAISDTVSVYVGRDDDCKLHVFPNPTQRFVTVTICTDKHQYQYKNKWPSWNRGKGLIYVISSAGQVVMVVPTDDEQVRLDLGRLSKGAYFIRYVDGDNVETATVIKQ